MKERKKTYLFWMNVCLESVAKVPWSKATQAIEGIYKNSDLLDCVIMKKMEELH